MSCDQADDTATFGCCACSRARTQRGRARRDQVGKNCLDNARAWAKLRTSMARGLLCLIRQWSHDPQGSLDDLSEGARAKCGRALKEVSDYSFKYLAAVPRSSTHCFHASSSPG